MITAKELSQSVKVALREHNASVRVLERKVRQLTQQRDAANGRVRELRAYVAKYQRDNVVLRREIRNA